VTPSSRSLEATLPWLYLKGISSGQLGEALQALLGSVAKGLSPGVLSRLKRQGQQEYHRWRQRPLGQQRWVYLWVDGIYSKLLAGVEFRDGVEVGASSQPMEEMDVAA